MAAPSSTISSFAGVTNGFKQLTGMGQPNLSYIIEATPNPNAPIP